MATKKSNSQEKHALFMLENMCSLADWAATLADNLIELTQYHQLYYHNQHPKEPKIKMDIKRIQWPDNFGP